MLNRREQIALLLLVASLLVGSAVATVDHYYPATVDDLRVIKGAVEPPVLEAGLRAGATDARPGTAMGPAERTVEPLGVVEINEANAVQLQRLPGIGVKTAQRIIEFRDAHGPFAAVAELQRVRGIGPRTMARLEPHVSVDGTGQTASAAAVDTSTTPGH